MRSLLLAALLGPSLLVTTASALPPPRSGTAADEYTRLTREYDRDQAEVARRSMLAASPAERSDLLHEASRNSEKFAGRFLKLAQQSPNSASTVDALTWVLAHTDAISAPGQRLRLEAIDVLAREHARDPHLVRALPVLEHLPYEPAEALLRLAAEKNPRREVRGAACLTLARYLSHKADAARCLKREACMAECLGHLWGKAVVGKLQEADPDRAAADAERFLGDVTRQYGDLRDGEQTASQAAAAELYELTHLAIGKVAPDIEGRDLDGKRFRLSDCRGKVVVLDFWGDW
jgi:hypothetical protein